MQAHEIDNYEDLLDAAEDQASSDWEMDFVSDMQNKFDEYGENTYISNAQLAKLEKIANG